MLLFSCSTRPAWPTEAFCFLHVHLFIHSFKQDILATNELMLMQIGASGPRGKEIKLSS